MIFRKKQYIIKDGKRQFFDFIPPISILMGGLIFIVGTVLAMLWYQTPNGGYQFFDQFFSELGLRNNYTAILDDGSFEFRYAPQNPELFNYSLFAGGILMMFFFLFSFRQMRNANRPSNFFLLIASLSGIAAGLMLIGVGLFDLGYPADVFWQEHGFWAGFLYIFITATSLSWFFMLMISKDLPYRKTKWILVDYLFLLVLAFLTIINLADGLNILFVKDIAYLNIYSVETYQKSIAYLFFMYYGLIVGVRLTKTKYDNTPVIRGIKVKMKDKEDQDGIFCTGCGELNALDKQYCKKCEIKLF